MAERPVVDFSWTPQGVPVSYTILSTTYPYSTQQDNVSRPSDSRYPAFTTPTNTLLTFTATVTHPLADGFVVEYKWDFGDGTIGYGATVAHTYRAHSPQTAVTLNVLDNKGNRVSRNRVMNLRYADAIITGISTAVA